MQVESRLFIGAELSAMDRIVKATTRIMAMPEFIAFHGIFMMGKTTLAKDIPTACTNGRDEMYNEEFVNELSDAELRFVRLHENFHKGQRDLFIWRWLYEEDAQCANEACDYVINGRLKKLMDAGMDIAMPKCALYDPQYDGMDAGQVYALLRREKQEKGGKGGKGGAGGKKSKCLDTHDWEGAESMTEEEKTTLAREIDNAIRQGSLVAGKLGGGADLGLGELLRPVVDWTEEMREFFTSTCTGTDYSTWRRPNRRHMSSGYYMPSHYSESVGEIVIAVDASGSTVGRVLTRFMTELWNLCNTLHPERVRILYWDTQVRGEEVYEQDELERILNTTQLKGGGGTTVTCVPAYMAEHGINPQAVVILTDGDIWGSWGEWKWPHLWCIAGSNKFGPTGRTIHIKE